MTCSVPGCTDKAKYVSKGWCSKHYQRWWKTGDVNKVRKPWGNYVHPTCDVVGCGRVMHARGLCTIHGPRKRRHGDPLAGRRPNAGHLLADDYFWKYVNKSPNGCWHWTAGKITGGYPLFKPEGIVWYVHRWSYERFVGPIPKGLSIDHLCHNRDLSCPGGICDHRSCVNPDHLEPVTLQENLRRGRERARKQRQMLGVPDLCKRGHPRITDNTYHSPSGRSYCRLCRKLREDGAL